MSNSLRPHRLQHARLPCPSLSPRICSYSCPLSWWCYLTVSSSAVSIFLQIFGYWLDQARAVPKRIWVQDFFPNCCIFFIDSVFCCCRCYKSLCFLRGSLYSQIARGLGVSRLCAMRETWVRSLGWEDPLEEGMATHSSILAWRIPYGQRSLEGYSPWGRKESDTIEQLSTAQHRLHE